MEKLLVVTSLCCLVWLQSAQSACDSKWSYDGKHGKGPDKWFMDYPECGHENQSPIDIDTSALVYDSSLTRVTLDSYFHRPANHSMVYSNNGHTVVVELTGEFLVHGGGLDYEYKAQQFHFHWGAANSRGSEHTIAGKAYPMELHIVHYSTNFTDFANAVDKPYGLAVLGFMFEITDSPNPNFEWLSNYSKEIPNCGDKFDLPAFMMDDLLAHDTEHYWRYNGSLTTPPCHESVVWTVFHETIKISQSQIDTFRALLETEAGAVTSRNMVDNFRPVQLLNNRTVYTSVKPIPATSPKTEPPIGGSFRVEANILVTLVACFLVSFSISRL